MDTEGSSEGLVTSTHSLSLAKRCIMLKDDGINNVTVIFRHLFRTNLHLHDMSFVNISLPHDVVVGGCNIVESTRGKDQLTKQ